MFETDSYTINTDRSKGRLAWHETLELHEIVAAQSNTLMQLKKSVHKIQDPRLRDLYQHAISGIEKDLKQLVGFYSYEPYPARTESGERDDDNAFYAGCLLGAAKNTVKMYAAAITETATPSLRKIFIDQLDKAIRLHYKIFSYMHEHGYYPAYDLQQLRENDLKNAHKALKM